MQQIKMLALITAVLAGAALALPAQDQAPPRRGRGQGFARGFRSRAAAPILLAVADRDRNGEITTVEWKGFLDSLAPAEDGTLDGERLKCRVLAAMLDRDGDGALEVADLETVFGDFDRDGDRQIAGGELGWRRRGRGRGPGAGRAGRREEGAARRAEIIKKYDANGNGVLDPEERDKMRADREEETKARQAEMVKKYDANGNGVLDPEERDKMRADRQRDARTRRAGRNDPGLRMVNLGVVRAADRDSSGDVTTAEWSEFLTSLGADPKGVISEQKLLALLSPKEGEEGPAGRRGFSLGRRIDMLLGTGRRDGPPKIESLERLFKRLDANGDGVLQRDELTRGRRSPRAQQPPEREKKPEPKKKESETF